jgi:tetratricopeptide (TPR) repeat protein
MADNLFHAMVRRYIFGLVGLLILAAAIGPVPIQAHIGISGQIEKVTTRIQNDPKAPELYLRRGDLHRINGHWTEAMEDFYKARQLEPDNAAAELGMGRTAFDQGLYNRAIEHLNRALTRQPANVRGLVTRAKAHLKIGEPLAAAADYNRAIDTFNEPDKPLPEYYFEGARAFEAAGVDYTGAAIQLLDDGTSRLGNVWVLEDYAIELERKRQNQDAALLRLDRVIGRSARKEALLMRRGEILLEADRPAAAEADFAAAREAIDALPARHRGSQAMKRLLADMESRMPAVKYRHGEE